MVMAGDGLLSSASSPVSPISLASERDLPRKMAVILPVEPRQILKFQPFRQPQGVRNTSATKWGRQ
jgi:hypothetical protein